jgi:hypothetical protein
MRRAFPEPSDLHPTPVTPTPRRAPVQPAAAPRAPAPAPFPPEGAWWNGIARAWFIAGPDAPQRLDPQPEAPVLSLAVFGFVPPAVKVSA